MTIDGIPPDVVEIQLRRALRRGLGPGWLGKLLDGVPLRRLVPSRPGYYEAARREIGKLLGRMRRRDHGASWFDGQKVIPLQTCPWCGVEFFPSRGDQRFCMGLHRDRFHGHAFATRMSAYRRALREVRDG